MHVGASVGTVLQGRGGVPVDPCRLRPPGLGEVDLAAAEALRRRVAQAARKAGQFTVAFMPGLIVTGPVRAFGDAHPELTVEVLRTSRADQAAVLHDGRADVSYVRLPVDRHGLQLRTLLREPNVAVLPAGHRLAGKETISLADLADEHLLQHPNIVPEWRATATEWRGRSHVPPLRITHAMEEKLERVAAGRGIVVLPQSAASYYQQPGVFHVRIGDIPPAETCLAWPSSRRSPLIAEFASLAAAHRPTTDE